MRSNEGRRLACSRSGLATFSFIFQWVAILQVEGKHPATGRLIVAIVKYWGLDMTKNYIRIPLVFTLLFACAVTAPADDVPVPKHLELGRTLVANVSSETTSYRHDGLVRWKGDFLVSRYQAHTDCSG